MNSIINIGLPHIAEQIFNQLSTESLFKCRQVSETWQRLVERILVERQVQLDTDHLDRTVFISACRQKDAAVVQLLIQNAERHYINFDIGDKDGVTGLMYTCLYGYKDVIKLLLNRSLNNNIALNAEDNLGRTAFHYACESGRPDVVKWFLDKRNVDFNARNSFGETPFMKACERGCVEVVEILLNYSEIDLNVRNIYGKTAFMVACEFEQVKIVRLLLSYSGERRIIVPSRDEEREGKYSTQIAAMLDDLAIMGGILPDPKRRRFTH